MRIKMDNNSLHVKQYTVIAINVKVAGHIRNTLIELHVTVQ